MNGLLHEWLMPVRQARRPQGFTLVEMMIAISILGFIMAAIYSTWSAVARSSKTGIEAAARVQRTRMAMRVLVDSLMSAQLFMANVPYYAFITDTSGDFAYLSLVSRLPQSFPRSGLYGDFSVRRVTFSVEPGQNGNQLVMWQEPVLIQTDTADEIGPLVVAEGVSMFVLEFWDSRANKWIEEWLPTNQLPKLVRVTLGFGESGFGQRQDIFSRLVAIPATSVPREYQIPPNIGGAPRPVGPRPGPGPADGGGPRGLRATEGFPGNRRYPAPPNMPGP